MLAAMRNVDTKALHAVNDADAHADADDDDDDDDDDEITTNKKG